jgi:hypothetical protein
MNKLYKYKLIFLFLNNSLANNILNLYSSLLKPFPVINKFVPEIADLIIFKIMVAEEMGSLFCMNALIA